MTRTLPLPLLLTTTAALTLPAQTNYQVGSLVVLESRIACPPTRLSQLVKSDTTNAAVADACRELDVACNGTRIEFVAASETGEFWLSVYFDAPAGLEPAIQQRIYAQVVDDLRQRLDRLLIERPRVAEQKALDQRLRDLDEANARRLDLRRQLAQLPPDTTAARRASITDYERQLLDTRLEQRTESATQDRVQILLATSDARTQDLLKQLRATENERDQIGLDLQALASATDPSSRGKAAELTARAHAVAARHDTFQREFGQNVDLVKALAEEARRSTITRHRAEARLQVLEDLLQEQRAQLQVATTQAGQREALQLEIDKLTEAIRRLEGQVDRSRERLADLEPVRLTIWK